MQKRQSPPAALGQRCKASLQVGQWVADMLAAPVEYPHLLTRWEQVGRYHVHTVKHKSSHGVYYRFTEGVDMKTTAELMQKALTIKPAAEWARQLGITRSLFTNAKYRGNLSPIVAGEIAGEIGEDPQRWIVIATLETGKDSACKERLLERLRKTHITLMM